MFSIFTGNAQDIYIHWLIVGMGIAVLICALAVFTSCRSFTLRFILTNRNTVFAGKLYSFFLRYHTYYWVAFWLVLVLHLMVSITHTGIPHAGDPFVTSHRFVLFTAIFNLVMTLIVFSSCKSFLLLARFTANRNPLNNRWFKKYYALHPYLWLLLVASLGIHIVSGMIHAINT